MIGAASLPRTLHPAAWWVWALGMATAATRTTNPLLLGLILAVAGVVVAARRGEAPWARGFRAYLILALVVIGFRVLFRILLGSAFTGGGHLLFTLPRIPLPHWMSGVRLGGPVELEGVLSAACDGLRLATLLVCVGAANTLANPKRVLRMLPGALYEIGTTVVIALTVAPQLIESGQRIRRARALRGVTGKLFRTVALPVLADALDRAIALAAAMDSRGYGQRWERSAAARRTAAALMLAGLLGLCVGSYGLLAAEQHSYGPVLLAAGAAVCCLGLYLGGRRTRRTNYRPDLWSAPEWTVGASGVAVAVLVATADPVVLNPPLLAPGMNVAVLAGILLGALPAIAAPPPPELTARYRPGELR
ncbi:energy-coupling factor transporter transmembrane component T [Amycolatopsis silviterrae]|uniref:Energy-coupling factor transporter transmembrane component T n=1 Tax=Amycolatopsis silviterrae TaxID=1656914 RepID=A0ABW5HPI6_9PSEU